MGDLISRIRQRFPERFENLYLESLVLHKSKRYVDIFFASKQVYSDDDKKVIADFVEQMFPKSYKVRSIEYSKIFCDDEIAINELKKIIKNDYPSLFASVSKISCKQEGEGFVFEIECNEIIKSYINSSKAENLIIKTLSDKYKTNFKISFVYLELPAIDTHDYASSTVTVIENEKTDAQRRIIEVSEVAPLIGKFEDNFASYIEDSNLSPSASIALCGKIKNLTERVTKSEKILFTFRLEDFTGKINCIIFPSAANLEKARQLADDTEVIASGSVDFDEYRNGYTFKIRQISYCLLPQNFTKVNKTSLPVPENYSIVFPQKIEVAAQVDFFGGGVKEVSKYFFNKTFVVFDIETTGLNYDLDKITEIGAIKIEDGIITQSFSTLINPEVHIREETVKLNGIDDEMVKDMPKIEEVLPDFYKFAYGAELVAHNIDFDFNFLRYNADKIGYYFYNQYFDTLHIARERVKGLSNYKLDTLCAYFNIELNQHHRAWHDALATAKLYIELMNIRVPVV